MSAFELAAVSAKGLNLRPVAGAKAGHIQMSGCGESDGVEVLRSFLGQLHDAALAAELEEIVVDLEDLTFINSSCLKSMVTWIYQVDTTGRPYRIQFIRDSRMHWQKGSLDTLRRLAPEVVQVLDAAS